MIRSFAAFFALLPTLLAAQTPMAADKMDHTWEQDQRWEQYQDLDGRFQLLTPAAFTHDVDTVETPLGTQILHTYHFQATERERAENIIYALSYVDYPEGTLHHDSTDLVREFLDQTLEEATAAVGGEVVYSSDKLLDGYPARQWRIDYNGGRATARTLAGVARNRYYEIKIFSVRAAGVNNSAGRFFDSVRLY